MLCTCKSWFKFTMHFLRNSADTERETHTKQESLALASMARDDPPASSMASSTAPLSTAPASSTAAALRGKVGSEFETKISYNAPMHFRHRQTDRQTDTGIIA